MAKLMKGSLSGYVGILTQLSLKLQFIVTGGGFNEVKKSKKQGNRLLKASCFPFKEEAGRIIAETIGSPLKGGENY